MGVASTQRSVTFSALVVLLMFSLSGLFFCFSNHAHSSAHQDEHATALRQFSGGGGGGGGKAGGGAAPCPTKTTAPVPAPFAAAHAHAQGESSGNDDHMSHHPPRFFVIFASCTVRYNFYLPLTVRAWRRIGFIPIVLLHTGYLPQTIGEQVDTNTEFVVKEILAGGGRVEYIQSRKTDFMVFVQTARLFAYLLPQMRPQDYIVLGDGDIWPVKPSFFFEPLKHQKELYVLNMPIKPWDQIPICYVMANVTVWEELMALKRPSDDGTDDRPAIETATEAHLHKTKTTGDDDDDDDEIGSGGAVDAGASDGAVRRDRRRRRRRRSLLLMMDKKKPTALAAARAAGDMSHVSAKLSAEWHAKSVAEELMVEKYTGKQAHSKAPVLMDINTATWRVLDKAAKHPLWRTISDRMKKNYWWTYDQMLLTYRIEKSGLCFRAFDTHSAPGGPRCYVARSNRRHPDNDDFDITTFHEYDDIHLPKPGFMPKYWLRTAQFWDGLWLNNPKMQKYADWYKDEFLRRKDEYEEKVASGKLMDATRPRLNRTIAEQEELEWQLKTRWSEKKKWLEFNEWRNKKHGWQWGRPKTEKPEEPPQVPAGESFSDFIEMWRQPITPWPGVGYKPPPKVKKPKKPPKLDADGNPVKKKGKRYSKKARLKRLAEKLSSKEKEADRLAKLKGFN
jgi:hypothetical protein